MTSTRSAALEAAPGVATLLVLVAGFAALFAGDPAFWLYWLVGFAVVVPLVSTLAPTGTPRATVVVRCTAACRRLVGLGPPADRSLDGARESGTNDALATLRDRYARGELTDEQFERKLDRLLETETPEDAVEWRSGELEEPETA